MAAPQRFSLKWNNYVTHLTTAFDSLRDEDDFVDCTLSCDGKRIKAHKMLLSACSSYFREIFKENPCQHPVIILKGVNYSDLESLVDFMYNGEVNVVQEQLGSFLNTAELLQVRGLTDGADKGPPTSAPPPPSQLPKLPQVPKEVPSPQSILPTLLPSPLPRTTHPPPVKRKRTAPPTDFSEHSMSSSSRSPAMPSPISHVNVSATANRSEVPVIDLDDDIPVKTEPETEFIDENDDDNNLDYGDEVGELEGDASEDTDLKLSSDMTIEPGPSDASMLSEPGTSGEGTSQDPSQGHGRDIFTTGLHGDRQQTSVLVVRDQTEETEEFRSNKKRKLDYIKIADNTYMCNICRRMYSKMNSMSQHMAAHTGQTKCPICCKVFSQVNNMKVHMYKIHKKLYSELLK